MTSDGFDLTIANSKSDRLFETLCHDSEWLKTERPDIKGELRKKTIWGMVKNIEEIHVLVKR